MIVNLHSILVRRETNLGKLTLAADYLQMELYYKRDTSYISLKASNMIALEMNDLLLFPLHVFSH